MKTAKVSLLLEARAGPEASSLLVACKHGFSDIADLLLKAGADVNQVSISLITSRVFCFP